VTGRADAGGPGAATRAAWRTPLLWMLPAIGLQALAALLEPPLAAGLSVVQALAALALTATGGWLMRGAAQELEWNATPVCVDEPARALVATGPYRVSRHPMYLGAVAVLLGVAVVLGSPLAAGVALAFGAWLDLAQARPEDARLRARFGPSWEAYAANVRRWV
jgi:protein-S-isoprenylcysteine O-methyltransferase Ste14